MILDKDYSQGVVGVGSVAEVQIWVQSNVSMADETIVRVCGGNLPLTIANVNSQIQLSHSGIPQVLTKLRTTVDKREVSQGPVPLTVSTDLCKLGLRLMIAPSSNGKTADSGSAYRGSNPCGAAKHCEMWIAKWGTVLTTSVHTPHLDIRTSWGLIV